MTPPDLPAAEAAARPAADATADDLRRADRSRRAGRDGKD